MNQSNKALLPLYLEQYQDENSQKITTDLQSILNDLFTAYGEMTDDELKEAENLLQEKIFDIAKPPIHIFRAFKELEKLATASHQPYTERQRVNLGLRLFKNMGEMEKARGDWLDKTQVEMTWINFERHFNKEWNKLQKLRGPTMKSTTYQQQA